MLAAGKKHRRAPCTLCSHVQAGEAAGDALRRMLFSNRRRARTPCALFLINCFCCEVTARTVQAVENMRAGMSATEAAEDAMRRILRGAGAFQGALVTLAADGGHGGAAVGWLFHYSVASPATGGAVEVLAVPPLESW